jgi:hypothetical protein
VDGARMVAFLEAVLDAKEGFRPPFSNRGHWVYIEDKPAIHIDVVERSVDFPQGIVNHVAFGVYEFEAAKARIEATGLPYKIAGIPETEIGQFFVTGPEGILVEVQFRRAMPAA